ncbi:Barwin-related endoglucanase [Gossypium australe]|uniref:Barwin-related endoglucanase n=1 Tax=Gossypium australe TaxID=47621 RepID=A0A5B6UTM7_9ROSI|nr:Barwin-related endoglucanase [Gossypium australe]
MSGMLIDNGSLKRGLEIIAKLVASIINIDYKNLFFVGMVPCLISFASATLRIATFYTKYVPSACFGNQDQGNMIAAAASACFGNQDQGKMIAAAGDALWDNGTVCGKMFTVTCTGPRNPVPHLCTSKSITVKIVDHCPGCPSTIDLSREPSLLLPTLLLDFANFGTQCKE